MGHSRLKIMYRGSHKIRKLIAGVVLTFEYDSDRIVKEYNSISEAFYFSESVSSADHQIYIRISNDRMPVFKHHTLLFNAQDSWYIYKDDRFYSVVLHPPGFQTPLWLVRIDHHFSNGIVYCTEHSTHRQNHQVTLYNPLSYPLDQILLMHYLARIGGMIIHSAGWRRNNSGWIFAGKSGAGKSTLSNLIVSETGGTFLSDDRIAVRKIGQEYLMYGTPWPGDAGYAVNESVPVKGIFFLNKGIQNDIKRLTISDAIVRLMPVVSIPWYDREKVTLMMDFCDALMGCIPMYELTFKQDKSVVAVLEQFIHEQSF